MGTDGFGSDHHGDMGAWGRSFRVNRPQAGASRGRSARAAYGRKARMSDRDRQAVHRSCFRLSIPIAHPSRRSAARRARGFFRPMPPCPLGDPIRDAVLDSVRLIVLTA